MNTVTYRLLSQVLSKLESAGFTLKKAKHQFGLKSICYIGHVINRHGLHPSPDKVKAVQEALEPKNVTELRAFLGLINYYHKFIHNLSCIYSPLQVTSERCLMVMDRN